MMYKEFSESDMYSYNSKNKKLFGIYLIMGIIIALIIFVYYIMFLKNSDNFFVNAINSVVVNIATNINSGSLLGLFYASTFGGLFFIVFPLEIAFIKSLTVGGLNPVYMIMVYVVGLLISFTIDYYIGLKFSGLSKKLIGPKKFYKIKGLLNKYGAGAIFVFNALPLPAQALTAILGVFRYNKTRFYVFFLTGQIIKYAAISVIYLYLPVVLK